LFSSATASPATKQTLKQNSINVVLINLICSIGIAQQEIRKVKNYKSFTKPISLVDY